MESIVQTEVVWEIRAEHTNTFELSAPSCGIRTDTVYQYIREYEVSFETQSLWRGPIRRDYTFREYTSSYDVLVDTSHFDESCGCVQPADLIPADKVFQWQIGNLSIRAPGGWSDEMVEVHTGTDPVRISRQEFGMESENFGTRRTLYSADLPYEPEYRFKNIPVEILSPYVAFLADVHNETVDFDVTLFSNEPLAQEP